MYELIDNAPAQWSSAFKAGLAYFVVAFGFGFLLDTFRMLVIVPAGGEISAVVLEMPIMLAISWFLSRWLIGWFSVPDGLAPRLVIGGWLLLFLCWPKSDFRSWGSDEPLLNTWLAIAGSPSLWACLASLRLQVSPQSNFQ